MLTLVFDTETTGFPRKDIDLWHESQPHLVQLATILADDDEILEKWTTIVSCPIEVPEKAFEVHGISMERSQIEGIESFQAARQFNSMLYKAERAVCHNVWFDFFIMKIVFARASINPIKVATIPTVCTMKTAISIVKATALGRSGYKWPTLDESYRKLVDKAGFEGAHSADADAMACFKVLRALEKGNATLVAR